jgi:hypothetical protein
MRGSGRTPNSSSADSDVCQEPPAIGRRFDETPEYFARASCDGRSPLDNRRADRCARRFVGSYEIRWRGSGLLPRRRLRERLVCRGRVVRRCRARCSGWGDRATRRQRDGPRPRSSLPEPSSRPGRRMMGARLHGAYERRRVGRRPILENQLVGEAIGSLSRRPRADFLIALSPPGRVPRRAQSFCRG